MIREIEKTKHFRDARFSFISRDVVETRHQHEVLVCGQGPVDGDELGT